MAEKVLTDQAVGQPPVTHPCTKNSVPSQLSVST
jgi:hypothetical protein